MTVGSKHTARDMALDRDARASQDAMHPEKGETGGSDSSFSIVAREGYSCVIDSRCRMNEPRSKHSNLGGQQWM